MNSFSDTLALGEAPRGERKTRVIVTGGSGKLGRSTVRYLADKGYEVINVDMRRAVGVSEDGKDGLEGAMRLVEIDLTDMGQVLETFMEIDMAYKGIDCVVHLAAIPSPGQSSSSNQFKINTMSSYNVLEACRKLGIRNLVMASSETLIGLPFPKAPEFIPITEETPRQPESAYSLSKLLGETMAEQYCRWDDKMKIISLRFSNVMLPGDYKEFESFQDDPMKRFWNMWCYIDARDGAQACHLALEKQIVGHHAYLIANSNTLMRMPNADLVKAVFPTSKYNPTKGPHDALLSIEKAKRDLGAQFHAASSFRDCSSRSAFPTYPMQAFRRLAHISRSMSTTAAPQLAATAPKFALSPIPASKEVVRTAACLIIGDEVLNGKTKDSNSNFLAQMMFDVGVELKRIEVIADDEAEIIEAVKRMHKNYDLVITSGGIGPTHDDITYSSIAAAFGKELVYNDDTIARMDTYSKRPDQTPEQRTARLRMALFPEGSEVLFVKEELWVPVVRVGGKVCILPGVPSLFQLLLTGLTSKFIQLPPASEKPFRVLVHTAMMESAIAPFLTGLQARVDKEGIRVGSYPKLHAGVDVSLIGKDNDRLTELAKEVVQELQGTVVSEGKMGDEKSK